MQTLHISILHFNLYIHIKLIYQLELDKFTFNILYRFYFSIHS